MSVLLFAWACAAHAGGAVIQVPGDHATIQAALDAAVDGDEVVVAPGTFNETLDFLGKEVKLRSVAGPSLTKIDGTGLDAPIVKFVNGEGPATKLDGFALTDGELVGADGAAIFILESSPTITGCRIIGNCADNGGGIFNLDGSPQIFSTVFSDNSAVGGFGGAIYNAGTAAAIIVDCEFVENTSIASCLGKGGAIYGDTALIQDSIFRNNIAFGFGCDGASGVGGGIWGLTSMIVRCDFIDNQASSSAADPEDATASAGAIRLLSGAVVGCRFFGNEANAPLGGEHAAIAAADGFVAVNCLFEGHASDVPIRIGALVNCTVVRNEVMTPESAIIDADFVANCIIWDNEGEAAHPVVPIWYSLVEGGVEGAGNIDGDPMFVDADGPDDDYATPEDNDYRLSSVSPAIDAGDNSLVPADGADLDNDDDTSEPVPFDLAGVARFVDVLCHPDNGSGLPPYVDMGAYETQDTEAGLDCNGNGVADGCDIAEGTSQDINENDVPDECECLGEIFKDGEVNVIDLTQLFQHWGEPGGVADVDGDGFVGVLDLLVVLLSWGPCV